MSDVVINTERLSKRYLLGRNAQREPYTALRDVLARGARNMARKVADAARGRPLVRGDTVEEFWAIRDVSFAIRRGEVVGIVGRNGAGKSTLLKLLSRITEPSAGSIRLKGRVASLLEVGTGFHPELTGRENIYLNGSILGMSRKEISSKFDEIVEFAEVERFLDTPVKRYSSGMYVRLAFAVAAHLDPEILIVDEVLAVGDAQFQSKCLGKMQNVAREQGRTVLFVSHNMGAVNQLCTRALLMNNGQLVEEGDTRTVVNSYLRLGQSGGAGNSFTAPPDAAKTCQIMEIELLREDGTRCGRFTSDEPIVIALKLHVRASVPGMYMWVDLTRNDGSLVWMNDSHDGRPNPLELLPPGEHVVRIVIPPRTVGTGDYIANFVLTGPTGGDMALDEVERTIGLSIEDFETRRGNRRPGFLSTCADWSVSPVQ